MAEEQQPRRPQAQPRTYSLESILNRYQAMGDIEAPADEEPPPYESLIHPAFRNQPEYRDEKLIPQPLRIRTSGDGFSTPMHVDLPIELLSDLPSLQQHVRQPHPRHSASNTHHHRNFSSTTNASYLDTLVEEPSRSASNSALPSTRTLDEELSLAAAQLELDSRRQGSNSSGSGGEYYYEEEEDDGAALDSFKIPLEIEPQMLSSVPGRRMQSSASHFSLGSQSSASLSSIATAASASSSRTSFSTGSATDLAPAPQPPSTRVFAVTDDAGHQRYLRASAKAMSVLGIFPPDQQQNLLAAGLAAHQQAQAGHAHPHSPVAATPPRASTMPLPRAGSPGSTLFDGRPVPPPKNNATSRAAPRRPAYAGNEKALRILGVDEPDAARASVDIATGGASRVDSPPPQRLHRFSKMMR